MKRVAIILISLLLMLALCSFAAADTAQKEEGDITYLWDGIQVTYNPNTGACTFDMGKSLCGFNLRNILECRPLKRNDIKKLTITGEFPEIEYECFRGMENLEEANIDGTCIKTWFGIFRDCKNLKRVHLTDTIRIMDASPFAGCKSLEEVNIPRSMTYITAGMFQGCDSLKSMVIPESITEIYDYSFAYCDNLESVYIPSTVTWIYSEAFTGCDKLTIYCEYGSVAERYAKDNNIPVVVSGEPEEVPIEIDKKATVYPGNVITLTPVQEGLTDATYSYKSSKSSIAKVNQLGEVKGIKSGKATITITSSHGETAKVTVTVKSVKIKLNKTSVSLKKGKTFTIKASQPNTKGAKYTYKTSNKKIATVDKKGKIKAVKAGSATITVTSSFGETAKVKVTVK